MQVIDSLADQHFYLIYHYTDCTPGKLIAFGIRFDTMRARESASILRENVAETAPPVILGVVHLERLSRPSDVRAGTIDLPSSALLIPSTLEDSQAVECTPGEGTRSTRPCP